MLSRVRTCCASWWKCPCSTRHQAPAKATDMGLTRGWSHGSIDSSVTEGRATPQA